MISIAIFLYLGQARNRWDGLTCLIFSIRYDNLSAVKFVVYPMINIGSFTVAISTRVL